MTIGGISVVYNPQHPPLLLLAVAQLQNIPPKILPFIPNEEIKPPGFVLLRQQQQQQQQQQQEQQGSEVLLSELEAAKRIASLTPQGQTLIPDREGEELLISIISLLLSTPYKGCLYTLGCIGSSSSSPSSSSSCIPIKEIIINKMNNYLFLRSFLFNHHLSLVDIAVYVHLRSSIEINNKIQPEQWSTKYPCIYRWYKYIHSRKEIRGPVEKALKQKAMGPRPAAAPAAAAAAAAATAAGAAAGGGAAAGKKDSAAAKESARASYEGKLEGAIEGKVVTRFPPEPSGYLHIGHAKAALLNHYFAQKYKGQMIIRFDDTNPIKEDAEYEESIIKDINKLNIKYNCIVYTSDYIQQLIDACTDMIKKGIFYVDNTDKEEMRRQRAEGVSSLSRDNTIEENLRRWQEMQKGSKEGELCCVRCKMNMNDVNKCMRDPVMFRCILSYPHHRYGYKYTVYPTYDYSCPVLDSWIGITHALRTNEYADRIPQYHKIQELMGLRRVHIYEFSRLCFLRTVLSKRKLKYFVDNHLVDGWDDPRMPTVRGMLRRGLTVEGLMEFILQQGPSKATNKMENDKLWSINKQIIDPIVPRFMAVDQAEAVEFIIEGGPSTVELKERQLHQKNPNLGFANLYLYNKILIEGDDAKLCEEGEEVTLMHWGNCIIEEIKKEKEGKINKIKGRLNLQGNVKTTKKKIHWAPLLPNEYTPGLTKLILREYDHLLTEDKIDEENEESFKLAINKNTLFNTYAIGDPNLQNLHIGDKMQLERRGYFILDKIEGDVRVLIKIPDGKTKAMSVISSKVDAAALVGGKKKH